jgi:biopolymer transport protein ExbD
VTASFALHKTIQTPTPDPDQKGATQSIQTLEELEGVAILVRIDGQNAITIDDEPLPDGARVADALTDKMRKEQKSEIIITADASAWHRTVVNVVDAANEVGMQKIRLATRSGTEE